jgi:ribonuclease T1
MRKRRASLAALVLAAVAVLFALWQQRGQPPEPASVPAPAAQAAGPPAPAEPAAEAPRTRSKLDALDAAERAEVEKTLALIERGGPFPFRQDGTVFGNRERRLPLQPRGYYREYTVVTPGAPNRGARRIVRGAGGETYYTGDHYGTFLRIDD